MKPIIPFALLGALLAVGAADAAVTDPVGYVSLGDTTTGQPAIKANTDVYFSIPLDRPTVFAGAVASVSGSTINLSGTPALGDLTTVPHVVRITGGPSEGATVLINANTATSATVTVPTGQSIAGATSISIHLAWTVGTVMGTAFPSGTQLFTLPSSSAFNPAAEGVYEWDGTNWIDTVNTGAPADADVLFQSETLIVRNVSASPVASFVITGEVPTINSSAVISGAPGGTDNAVSFQSPVDEPIGTSGLSAIANPGDQVFGFDNGSPGLNKAGAFILEWDGADWIDTVNTGAPDNTFPLGGGRGFIFRRASVGAPADVIWSNEPNYVPGL